jgi:DNA polymerase III subunit beta
MKITVDRSEFASAFGWVHSGLPRRAVVPVLSAVQLTADSHTLTLAAFDYERSTRGWLPGSDAEAGQVLVDGKALKRVVSTLPKDKRLTMTLAASEQALAITSKGARWTLPAIPADEYPRLPDLPPEAGVVDGEAFARSVTRVAVAAARDSKQQALTCVQLTADTGELNLAATDGYRLAADRLPWTSAQPAAERREVLVPAPAALAFAKKAGHFGKVTVYLSSDLAAFRDDAREMTIRTLGTGPGYVKFRRHLRSKSPVRLTADARELAAVIDRMGKVTARIPAGAGSYGAVDLRYAGSVLTCTAIGEDGAPAAAESLPAWATGAGQFEVRLSPDHLASLLTGIHGQVVIGLTGELPDNPGTATVNAAGSDPFRAVFVTMKKASAPAAPEQ